ncbi:hypothetical protein PR048_015605 [Dryococelus australis]|uniref:ZNF598/HEL2 PAH domain-containing protein n=1 Tax=Dryococelus australis TaxID=614101 RepID=A0ABQ9HHE2_9NEOP|nr:hypothetical protein PR048_015605 [Dryococelus australis]
MCVPAHRALVHGRTMGKAAAKQARTLELEFTLAPRARDRDRDRKMRDRQEQEALMDTAGASKPNTISAAEFPSLGEPHRPNSGVTIRTMRQTQPPLAITDENFPILTSSGATATKTVRLSVNSSSQELHGTDVVRNGGPKPTNLSIHVNRRPGGTVTRLSGSQNVRIRPPVGEEDFPSLPIVNKPAPQNSASGKLRFAPAVQSARSIDDASGSQRPVAAPTTMQLKKATHVTIPVGQSNGEVGMLSNIKFKSKKKKAKSQNVAADSHCDRSCSKMTNPTIDATKKSSGTEEFEQLLKQQLMLKDPGKHTNGTEEEMENTNWNVTERKRSELLVGKLCQGNAERNNSDVPSCSDIGNVGIPEVLPPPGFSGITMSRGPPPGFSVKLNSVARSQSNRLTFTSSSGRSYPISSQGMVAGIACAYYPPPNFEHRNEVLMVHVMNSLQDYSLERFRDMSKKFRQGNMTAEEFYMLCKEMMGHHDFLEIFPELLVLLPDITKQQVSRKHGVSCLA